MAKLVELPPTSDKLDLAIDFCSDGNFSSAKSVSDAIIADIQSYSDPKLFLLEKCNIDLDNDDTGSIGGYDASGGPVLNKYDIVPEDGTVADLVIPPTQEVINGLTVTYPPYNSLNPSGQFIMKCMSKWWLKGAFDLVEQGFGLKFDDNSFTTNMPIDLADVPPSGNAITMAYVSSMFDGQTGTTVSISCSVNTNPAAYGDMDLSDPNGRANSFAGSNAFLDRILCHELVHAVMSANISGFNFMPKWFKEGSAELIVGADDTRKDELLATASSVAMFQAGFDDNTSDVLRWYTTGYIWLRWYINHVSDTSPVEPIIPMPDLSFDHLLPDIEVFEYKVSDGIAFEWGRANNCKFNLVSDELLDFVLRNHSGLSKWDLCTSEEYLHSGFGSTVRVPYDDACDVVEFDYIDMDISSGEAEFITVPSSSYFASSFVYESPIIAGTYVYGAPMPHKSSMKYKDACRFFLSLVDSSILNRFGYYISYYLDLWNVMLGMDAQSGASLPLSSPIKVQHVILVGNNTLSSIYHSSDGGLADAKQLITDMYQLSVMNDRYVNYYDFSFDLDTIINNNISDVDYANIILYRSADDLELINYIKDAGYQDRIKIYDCRSSILDTFTTVQDFKNRAICDYLPDNPIFGPYPVMQNNAICFTEFFADIIWDNLNLSPRFYNAEFKEISYTIPEGYVVQPSYDVNYESQFALVRDKMIDDGIYYDGFCGLFSLFSPIYNNSMHTETKYGGPKFNFTPFYTWYNIDLGDCPYFYCPIPNDLSSSKQVVKSRLDDEFYKFVQGPTSSRGQMLVSGLEVLCIFDFSVQEVIDMFSQWSVRAYDIEEQLLNIAFIPTCIYSKTIYNFYVELKNACIANDIPIALDNYVCFMNNSVNEYKRFCSLIYCEYPNYSYEYFTYIYKYNHIVDSMNSSTNDTWVCFNGGLNYFYFGFSPDLLLYDSHISRTKKPCYYVSFTDLPFSYMSTYYL